MANIFNEFFVNVASNIKDPVPEHLNFDYIKDFINEHVPVDVVFEIPEVTQSNIRKQLLELNVSKATGIDNIGPKLLKLSADIIVQHLTVIINKSLQTSTFPEAWKFAKVKPLFKSGKTNDVNNYRPISILPSLSKLFERHVHKSLQTFLDQFNLLHKTQSGFRTGHSTESALLYMIDKWIRALNEGKLIGIVMVDFRKAFDLVDHTVLLKKLSLYKCSNNTLKLFQSYLCDRKQTVSINDVLSENRTVNCGVPQGSILGPLLFLLFINDLPLMFSNKITGSDLYADDTTLYDIHNKKEVLETRLQQALEDLKYWCFQNGMKINTDKTKVLFMMTAQRKCAFPNPTLSLKYENILLKTSKSEKLLGVHIQDSLKWDSHIKYIVKKISTNIWLLGKIRYIVNLNYRILYYKAYIQPHFDYCCIIWGNTTQQNINTLLRLQRRACKYILGQDYISLRESMSEINIMTFDQRIIFQKAVTMYKIMNNLVPNYLNEHFQLRHCNSVTSDMTLRNVSNMDLYIPRPRCEMYKKSLEYSGPKIWNCLPFEIKTSRSLNIFKTKCKVWIQRFNR